MFKLFVYTLLVCILASNTDLIKALIFYIEGTSSFEQSMSFMEGRSLVDRFYMLAGNAFNYASVLFMWILLRKKDELPKVYALYLSLVASFTFYLYSTYQLWLPIAEGAQMNDNFALGFVKITLYTNIVGLLAGLLGLNIGKYRQSQLS